MGDKIKNLLNDDICVDDGRYDDIDMKYVRTKKKPRKKKLIVEPKCEEIVIVAEEKEKEVVDAIIINDEKKINNTVTKLDGNLLKYLDKSIRFVVDNNGNFWFCGKDVATLLKYTNTNEIISKIDDNNKKIYGELISEKVGVEKSTPKNTGSKKSDSAKTTQKQTVFISKESTIWLAVKSSARCAQDFQNYIKKLLDKIDNGEDIYEEDVISTETKFVKHPNAYEPYVKYHSAFDIKDENTLYLAEIGVVDEVGYDTNVKKGQRIFKLGITDRGLDRDHEHQKNIDDFVTFYYVKYAFNKRLEDALKYELKCKSLMKYCRFNNGIKYTELFTIDEHFTIDDVKCFIDDYIAKHDVQKECSGEYLLEMQKQKTRELELNLELAREKTAQLKCMLDILNNPKIELVDQLMTHLKNQ